MDGRDSMGNEENAGRELFLKSAYYTGKLLHATDLIREQNYGNSKQEFLNRKFYGWGIIEGLEVRAGQGGKLFLSRGSALDPRGRILRAPEDRMIKPEDIEGLLPEREHDFVLGIRYAERTLETERDYLKSGESYQPSIIAESYSLCAFEMPEYRKLVSGVMRRDNLLTEEKTLYESGTVELSVKLPRIVPEDSLFKLRIQVRSTGERNCSIGWHGMLKLQGAFFAQTGESGYVLEEEPAMCSGSLQREWEICTEENRTLPVMLEISHLEIVTGNGESTEIAACRFQVETTSAYDRAIQSCLQERTEPDYSASWVPLAHVKWEKTAFSLIEKEDLRVFVSCPWKETVLKRIAEENGILDIRWRRLFKHSRPYPIPPAPRPPWPPEPAPGPPQPVPMPPQPPVQPPEGILTERRFWELVGEDRAGRINRGILVIPVPKRCRKGQVLFSEEVSHGFPGEEVFLRCGRVWEEQSYAYWEKDRKRYRIIHGSEGLFSDVCDGQEIERQAVLQNVESGTFQVALTLGRRCRRKRSKEVAISWIAVRSV